MPTLTSLDLINEIDSFPYQSDGKAHTLMHQDLYTLLSEEDSGVSVPLGYVPLRVLEELKKLPVDIRGEIRIDSAKKTLCVFNGMNLTERGQVAARVAHHWRAQDTFPILRGWRDELWPVYGSEGQLLYNLERCATGLFGFVRYGVHLNAFVRCSESSHGIKMWVAKRSPTKSTFPDMLDNAAAGGLMTGEDPLDCIIREADEEADLAEKITRESIKAVGGVSYIYVTREQAGEAGLIYPEVQWIYDLELPEHIIPKPKDGEVAGFKLCSIEEVQQQLREGLFKPNCALVVIDFFIRHGIITRENEPEFDEINRRIHRKLPFPGPHHQNVFTHDPAYLPVEIE